MKDLFLDFIIYLLPAIALIIVLLTLLNKLQESLSIALKAIGS